MHGLWYFCDIFNKRIMCRKGMLFENNRGWGGCHLQPWHNNDIILTPQVTQYPKIRPKYSDICVRFLPYAHGLHINVLKHLLYVSDGCGKQIEEDVSLNHDITASFWLHKWPSTPKSEPSSVDNCVRLLPHTHRQPINALKHFVYV